MTKYIIDVVLIIAISSLAFYEQIEWADSVIISLLAFIVVELISQYFTNKSHFNGVNSSINDINYELKSISNGVQLKEVHHDLKSNIKRISHPYFASLFTQRLEKFNKSNLHLFNGDHTTSPFSADTYGALGLLETTDNLKCVSSFDDYWDDRGNSDYYYNQLELIKNGIRIQRLFVIDDTNMEKANNEMKRQKADGIDVRSIEKYKFGDTDFFRDYLIQDNTLLVDLIPRNTANPKHGESDEKITTNLVKERVVEFNQYWSHATKA